MNAEETIESLIKHYGTTLIRSYVDRHGTEPYSEPHAPATTSAVTAEMVEAEIKAAWHLSPGDAGPFMSSARKLMTDALEAALAVRASPTEQPSAWYTPDNDPPISTCDAEEAQSWKNERYRVMPLYARPLASPEALREARAAERERCASVVQREADFAGEQLASINNKEEANRSNVFTVRQYWRDRQSIAILQVGAIRALPEESR